MLYPSRREVLADEASPIRSQIHLREVEADLKTLTECEYQSMQSRRRTPRESAVGCGHQKHLDDDTEEATDLRHGRRSRVAQETSLRVFCLSP